MGRVKFSKWQRHLILPARLHQISLGWWDRIVFCHFEVSTWV